MTTALVTGCAGFIGSHLTERLLERGDTVIGIDGFTPYYSPARKRANLELALQHPAFRLIEGDLVQLAQPRLTADVDVVYHLAAQAGVRASWSDDFEQYTHHNVLATQRLLEACARKPLSRFIFASSSSIYGEADRFPTSEDADPAPLSPYGVTKLACEYLCRTYLRNFGVPVVLMRFFSVYGPRQRPDMAFQGFIERALRGEAIEVFAGGNQTRDFTYVSDIVDGLLAAAHAPAAAVVGEAFNLSGGSRVTLSAAIDILERHLGIPILRTMQGTQKGDPANTGGDLAKSHERLQFQPAIALDEGLARQVAWARARA